MKREFFAAVLLVGCTPASRVDIGEPTPDVARAGDAVSAPADAASSTADAVSTLDAAPTPPDASGADAHPVTGDAHPLTGDAHPLGGDAKSPPGDAVVSAADAFVHIPSEAGHADAALSLEARLAACDDDPLLAGVVADDEGWGHVPAGTEVNYTHNPPGSGPHYGQWVRSGIYAEAIDRRNWVHNLEHGWMVLLHRPDAPLADVRVLTDAYAAGLADAECPDGLVPRIVVTPDPLLATPVAAVTAYRVLAADHVTPQQLAAMFASCRIGATELRVCGDGQVPAPPSMAP